MPYAIKFLDKLARNELQCQFNKLEDSATHAKSS